MALPGLRSEGPFGQYTGSPDRLTNPLAGAVAADATDFAKSFLAKIKKK
jgi:hypothetical protein